MFEKGPLKSLAQLIQIQPISNNVKNAFKHSFFAKNE